MSPIRTSLMLPPKWTKDAGQVQGRMDAGRRAEGVSFWKGAEVEAH